MLIKHNNEQVFCGDITLVYFIALFLMQYLNTEAKANPNTLY